MKVQELFDVCDCPSVIAAPLNPLHGLDVARRVGRQVTVFNPPSAERGEMLAAVRCGAGLVGLYLAV
jgi:hypothetical protein